MDLNFDVASMPRGGKWVLCLWRGEDMVKWIVVRWGKPVNAVQIGKPYAWVDDMGFAVKGKPIAWVELPDPVSMFVK